MFTTYRRAVKGKFLEEIWTQAEALAPSGNWYPLRSRQYPRPIREGLRDGIGLYDGPPPLQWYETWEFPTPPEVSRFIQVRVFLDTQALHKRAVEFDLPNDVTWRKRSESENLRGFHPQEWLNEELVHAAMSDQLDYVKDLVQQGRT
jgi:hypothetical protein